MSFLRKKQNSSTFKLFFSLRRLPFYATRRKFHSLFNFISHNFSFPFSLSLFPFVLSLSFIHSTTSQGGKWRLEQGMWSVKPNDFQLAKITDNKETTAVLFQILNLFQELYIKHCLDSSPYTIYIVRDSLYAFFHCVIIIHLRMPKYAQDLP